MKPIIDIEDQPDEGWGEWDDEVKDKKVAYMEELIGEKYVFRKDEWPGGDSSEPLRVVVDKPVKSHHKKHVVERVAKTGIRAAVMRVTKTVPHKKVCSNRKQRRISGYMKRRAVDEPSTMELFEELKELKEKISKLEAKTTRQSKKNQTAGTPRRSYVFQAVVVNSTQETSTSWSTIP